MPGSFFELPLRRVAVVLIDFQNDFCSPEVASGPPTNTHNATAAHRANEFAGRAIQLGARVVYTRQVLDVDHLTERQRRWERADGLCVAGSWGAQLFVPPVPGSDVITKYRFDSWQSKEFTDYLADNDIDGLVICGVELVCCVLYAVLGAQEHGYRYLIAADLVSGQDFGDDTDNRAVRDFLRFNQADHLIESDEILAQWHAVPRTHRAGSHRSHLPYVPPSR